MVNADGRARPPGMWASYLARNSALVSWLWLTLSVVLGRPDPRQQLRNAGAYLALSLIGCVVLAVGGRDADVVRTSSARAPEAFIVFGQLGKIYLMYLVVAMVAVLMNLESMLRNAPAHGAEAAAAAVPGDPRRDPGRSCWWSRAACSTAACACAGW